MTRCCMCGAELGPERRSDSLYCSAACRMRAYRARRSQGETGSPAIVPAPLRPPGAKDVASLWLCAMGLEQSFRRAANRNDDRLGPMCRRMADAIEAAVERERVQG